ncbi:MAG: IS200/IS605 family transposase [Flavobacteriales bacterium]|nr:IS200/IS605 family transposase [Flavobacteriales bacterium]
MANTYSQILIQVVFAVERRENLINEEIREELEKYICAVVKGKGAKPIAIYCNPDHCHLLFGLPPSVAISDLCREIKKNSTNWSNEKKGFKGKFRWQRGFGAFSYSKSQLSRVANYIWTQPQRHKRGSYQAE